MVAIDEHKLIASVTKECYYEFVKEFWEVVSAEKPVWNWHIEYLCEEIQIVMERVFLGLPKLYDLVVNISPGTTKSSVASIFLVPWAWTRMPSLRCIHGSHTDLLVLDLSRRARAVVQSEKYQKCFPGITLIDDQNTKEYFVNNKMGDRFSCTIGGRTPTGMHGHIHVVDDPIDPRKAISDLEIHAANTWMSETLSTRKVDKAITPLFLIMQRLAQNDPSGWRLAKDKVKHICLPAEITDNVSPPELRSRYVNGLMDPVRLPWEVLEEAKKEGDYFYAGQFLQHPVPLGGGLFKVDSLKIQKTPPTPNEFKKIVRYWDNAGSPKKGDRRRAYTVGVKMGVDKDGRFWVLDVQRVRLGSYERESLKKNIAIMDGGKVIIVQEQEGGSGGQESAENTIRNLAGFRVKIDLPRGNKEQRADPFSYQVNGGNVYLVEAPWNKDYIEEMKYFPFSTYKDQVDASSGAFAMLFKLRRTVGAI